MSEPLASPTPPSARRPSLDALRGLSLLGIALVNVPWIGSSRSLLTLLESEEHRAALPPWDLAFAGGIELLAEGRFYPIFSALFGMGMGVMLARGAGVHLRRTLFLLALGVLHASIGWWGDILTNYALVALLVWPLARLSPRALAGVALGVLAGALVSSHFFDGWYSPDAPEAIAESEAYAAADAAVYSRGSFLEITQHRFAFFLSYLDPWNWSYRLNTVAMALLGLAAERAKLRERLGEIAPRLPRIGAIAIVLGVVLSAGVPLWTPFYVIAGDVMALGYASFFLWLAERGSLGVVLGPLAAAGRMALTCYLLQTVSFTLVFYGYGLALYDRVGPAAGAALALVVWAAGTALATLWLRRFRQGPMEALWRLATYGPERAASR